MAQAVAVCLEVCQSIAETLITLGGTTKLLLLSPSLCLPRIPVASLVLPAQARPVWQFGT